MGHGRFGAVFSESLTFLSVHLRRRCADSPDRTAATASQRPRSRRSAPVDWYTARQARSGLNDAGPPSVSAGGLRIWASATAGVLRIWASATAGVLRIWASATAGVLRIWISAAAAATGRTFDIPPQRAGVLRAEGRGAKRKTAQSALSSPVRNLGCSAQTGPNLNPSSPCAYSVRSAQLTRCRG
jgi:hypothetical protein